MLSMSRFVFVERQYLPFPGTCIICGSNQRDCIDFGANIEYHGALLMCISCVKAMIDQIPQLEVVRKEEADKIASERDRLGFQHHLLMDGFKELKHGVVAAIDDYGTAIGHARPEPVVVSATSDENFFNLSS